MSSPSSRVFRRSRPAGRGEAPPQFPAYPALRSDGESARCPSSRYASVRSLQMHGRCRLSAGPVVWATSRFAMMATSPWAGDSEWWCARARTWPGADQGLAVTRTGDPHPAGPGSGDPRRPAGARGPGRQGRAEEAVDGDAEGVGKTGNRADGPAVFCPNDVAHGHLKHTGRSGKFGLRHASSPHDAGEID